MGGQRSEVRGMEDKGDEIEIRKTIEEWGETKGKQ